jgi:hypothetical protein
MQSPNATLLRGGMDLVTPAAAMPGGHVIGGVNYEAVADGYARVGGYERLDGRMKPHLASYWILRFTEGVDPVWPGETVTGASTDAAALVLADSVTTGEYGASVPAWGADLMLWGSDPIWWGDPAAGYLVLTELVGQFEAGETVTVGAGQVGIAADEAQEQGAPTDAEQVEYLAAAVERRRALIQAVPGSGPVRGAAFFGGEAYAIRNNAGGTAGVLHRATSSGWAAITPNPIVAFTAGTARFADGETLTRGGATATIQRQVTTGGDYSGGTATGYLVLSGVSGTFTAGVATSASGSATIAGAPAVPAIPPGGRYDFTSNNFKGVPGGARLYMAGGVGRAFEFSRNPDVLAQVRAISDEALDKPTHVAHFQKHLFLAYGESGSVLHSGTGEPLDFRTTAGGGEIKFGATFTGFAESAATTLVFAGLERMSYLVGTSAADFDLRELSEDSGARDWTIQNVGRPIYMDAIGIRDLSTADTLGGWRRGTLTTLVEPLFRAKKPVALASVRVRAKDQYRVYWRGGDGLNLYVGREGAEAMPLRLPVEVNCAASGLDADGAEVVLLGAANGFVYEADVGTSFDGAEIEALIRLAYNHAGSPYRNKVFHSGKLELEGFGRVELAVVAEYGYGDPALAVADEALANVSAGGGLYDLADWDRFVWSGHDQGMAFFDLHGFGPNVSIALASKTATEQPHTLSTLVLNVSPRGMVR